ncbi:ERCC4 domain protein (plasmid) [Thioalkalivibrio sp. K90mix]|uniref:ERCC4 domain-containing protein n=1 Tax=Thioalkalivibrio sp. (strain K90mix) TaxID=396595 RepID=UPI000195A5F2|nr:ERCC4 domain-containing protein [Thioalkalivibrio sp. K90mix]ADC73243.1 ERCC4 domain protein [Thioalkalivibrio sp. K90mix]
MMLAHWQHPKRPSVARVYINGIPGLGRETIAYFERAGFGGRGVTLLVNEDRFYDDVLDALVEAGILDSEAEMASLTLDAVLARQGPSASPVVSGRPKTAVVPSGSGPAYRAQEVAALDPHSIPVPDPVLIRIDHREPPALFDALADIPNVQVERCELPMADLEVNERFVIERKSCRSGAGGRSDFESSVIDDSKRLFFQSEKMRLAEDCVPVVILEGEPHLFQQSMTPAQVDGAISFLVTVQRLNVIVTHSVEHTAYLLVKLATHDRSGLGYVPPLRGKKPSHPKDQLAFVLEGLPGMSGSLAKRLAAHYDTIGQICNATDAELLSIEGIGPKRLEGMRKVLG